MRSWAIKGTDETAVTACSVDTGVVLILGADYLKFGAMGMIMAGFLL
jgi:hypothetical protein